MHKPDKKARLKLPRLHPPVRVPWERVSDFREIYLDYDPESAMAEAQRCVEWKDPLCERACPLRNRIRDWLILTAEGRFLEAAALSRSTNNMPEICGRICPQDRLCEAACILGVKSQPLAIGAIERFINEHAVRTVGGIPMPQIASHTGRRVAVIGAGPSGLACAEELRKMGHDVTVFEAHPRPGGLLRYGIPRFKLERWVVERRMAYLKRLGIHFIGQVKVGRDLSLQDLFDQGFDAIFMGTGAQRPKNPELPGLDLEGVHEALPFLIRTSLDAQELPPGTAKDDLQGQKLVVFGGGDTAMDCLRTAVRLGADRVVCVYRRDEESMPGSRQEVKRAKEEGVEFLFLSTPVRFVGDGEGHVRQVECLKMRLGDPDANGRRCPLPIAGSTFALEVDFAILAFGFEADPVLDKEERLRLTGSGTYEVDQRQMTSWPGVFAGGDAIRGAALLATALKDGRDAASHIDQYLRGLRSS
jgi:glutamate synthase (NADPH/NADH) small chain